MKVTIDQSLCIACGLCREACPEGAVHPMMQDIHHRFEVIQHECTGCGDCLPYCPVPDALKQYDTEQNEFRPRGEYAQVARITPSSEPSPVRSQR